ncbi:MAG: nuclear transport factor 2 family protein [Flammeovirgaceae bacterium]
MVTRYINNILIGGATDYGTYFTTDFVQHDPELANGIAGLQSRRSVLTKSNHQPLFKVLGQGNFVLTIIQGQYNAGAGLQDAGLYSLFRMENDKIVEPWSTW